MTGESRRHGILYPTLHRLEEQSLPTSLRQVGDGKAICPYFATPAGEKARERLAELANELAAPRNGVSR